jgi:hypothetical protein
MKKRILATLCAVLLPGTLALATAEYDYGVDEFVTIQKGMSPDHKYAITAHGGSEDRDEFLRIFLTNAVTGKKIGPLEEIKEHLDTAPEAYAAKWSKDSQEVTIVWRIDRHEPLRVVVYHIADGRAKAIKGPTNANKEETNLWAKLCGGDHPAPPEKAWGTPIKR